MAIGNRKASHHDGSHYPAITQPLSVKPDLDLHSKLDRLARVNHRTTEAILCEAVTQFVKHEQKREAFPQDALKA